MPTRVAHCRIRSLAAAPRCQAILAVAALAAFASPATADLLNAYKVVLTINGTEVVNVHGGGGGAVQTESTRTQSGVTATLAASANLFALSKAELAGTGAATALVQSTAHYTFVLTPPAGADVKGGRLVLRALLEGSATGTGNLQMVTALQLDGSVKDGTASASIAPSGPSSVEFDLVGEIAPYSDVGDLRGRVQLHVDATASLPGGTTASARAEGTNRSRITGFRVLNSAKTQVTGFTMAVAGGSAIPELAAGPSGATVTAVEFFHAGFKHYFVSADAAEIAKLDNGTFAGWARTGQTFKVNPATGTGLAPVCRFFTVAFPPTSSHFYAPRGLGCEGTLANDKWQFEGDVFFVALPDAAGTCPAGTVPVFRLYNNGQGGAPNHRFTTSDTTRAQMIAQGYIAEGAGTGVGFCAAQ